MRKLSADLIITNDSPPLSQHCLLLDGDRVIDIIPVDHLEDVEHYKGVITPGFINAHCHLELSHLKDQIDTGTGLIPFIKGVVTLRDFPKEVINTAIIEADKAMYDAGIVAVGDISNQIDTIAVKDTSPIRYYTFVEMFDFLQDDKASEVFNGYMDVFHQHSNHNGNRKSCVPHAPYSVSPALFNLINGANRKVGAISIHNQELVAEDELFMDKTGGFIDFYKDFGIPLDQFSATGSNALEYAINHMDDRHRTLFVHNTQTTISDINKAHQWNRNSYWVTCPNANLYIENQLPNYAKFLEANAKMCIGTDSLSSNWSLSILEEMKTIKKYQSYVNDLDIIQWATANGAQALGFDDDLGTISIGKSPGINLIDLEVSESGSFDLSTATGVQKLA